MDRLVELPLKKSVEIAFKSIRVRFFRSLITTLSLVLAIAFLSYVQAGNLIAESILSTGGDTAVRTLVQAGYDVEAQGTRLAGTAKQRWIIFLSLLVCVVGIVNAQLMAVTERFREIGTMKCLGALNRFILRLFMLEALMQGLAGAFSGAVLGTFFAILSSLLLFGSSALQAISLSGLGVVIATATATGCLLSLVGVTYPAFKAATMEPVEAMRVEK